MMKSSTLIQLAHSGYINIIMRYLLSNNFINELDGRSSYLYDVFHLYFSTHCSEGFIHLSPMGTTNLPFLFLVGHNISVYKYLENNYTSIQEKIIVIVSCVDKQFINVIPNNAHVFATNSLAEKNTKLFRGSDYGFSFDISEAELKFFNSKEPDIIKRICNSFFEIQFQ